MSNLILSRPNLKQLATDMRGYISTGTKTVSSGGQEIPKSLEYFNLEKFPELLETYGDKPTHLLIMFPTNNAATKEDQLVSILFSEFNSWGKGKKSEGAIKKESCDRETYTDHIKGKTEPCKCEGIECSKGLKRTTIIRAMICDPWKNGIPILPICYRFRTGSPHSGDNLIEAVHNLWEFTSGRMFGVPLIISVKMVEKLIEGQKHRFPIWHLQPYGTGQQILDFAERAALPISERNRINVKELTEVPLNAPAESNGNNKGPQESQQSQPETSPDDNPKIESIQDQLQRLFAQISRNAADQRAFRVKVAQQVFKVQTWKEVTALDQKVLHNGCIILNQLVEWGNKQKEPVSEQKVLDKLDDFILEAEHNKENQPELF